MKKKVHERDNWTCRLCGRRDASLTPAWLTITSTEYEFEYTMLDGRYESVRREKERERVEIEKRREEHGSSDGILTAWRLWHLTLWQRCEESARESFRHWNPFGNGPLRRVWNVDHILPLVLDGSDNLGNLQLLCPVCSYFKTERDMRDMMERLAPGSLPQ